MRISHKILYALFALAVILTAWTAALDQPAAHRVEAGMKRALISFASARALNAVISAVQGTQVSAQPFGVGVTVTPGQLLAPVNNVVGHFADLMLVASVALGIERVLIEIGGYWAVSLALTLVAAAWAGTAILRKYRHPWLAKLLVVLLLVRFAVPVCVISSEWVWQQFLAPKYTESQDVIATTASDAGKLNGQAAPPAANPGLADRIQSWLSRNADVKARFDELKGLAERATEHIIKLMAIFLLQTVVVPLLLLWFMGKVVWAVLMRPTVMHSGGK